MSLGWYVHPVFALACVPGLLLAYRTLRIGVVVSSEGVLVRNVLRLRRVRWARSSGSTGASGGDSSRTRGYTTAEMGTAPVSSRSRQEEGVRERAGIQSPRRVL